MFIIVFTMILIIATMIHIVFTKIGNVMKRLKYACVNWYIIAKKILKIRVIRGDENALCERSK